MGPGQRVGDAHPCPAQLAAAGAETALSRAASPLRSRMVCSRWLVCWTSTKRRHKAEISLLPGVLPLASALGDEQQVVLWPFLQRH